MGLQSKRIVVTNPKQCTGCHICELICSFTKFKVFNPRMSMIRIDYDYKTYELKGVIVCTQCGMCISVCPSNALANVNGIVVLDHSKCTGCLTCASVCPYNAIVVINGRPYKCDLCGGNPQCVRYCVRGVLSAS